MEGEIPLHDHTLMFSLEKQGRPVSGIWPQRPLEGPHTYFNYRWIFLGVGWSGTIINCMCYRSQDSKMGKWKTKDKKMEEEETNLGG